MGSHFRSLLNSSCSHVPTWSKFIDLFGIEPYFAYVETDAYSMHDSHDAGTSGRATALVQNLAEHIVDGRLDARTQPSRKRDDTSDFDTDDYNLRHGVAERCLEVGEKVIDAHVMQAETRLWGSTVGRTSLVYASDGVFRV